MEKDRTQTALDLVRKATILRPRDLEAHGIPRVYLRRLLDQGLIRRVGRGLYEPVDAEVTENHSLAEACKRIPHGVICLLSALQFHGLTSQIPSRVWMAIDVRARRPKVDWPPIRFYRFSRSALNKGIEDHRIESVPVRVYNPAKTVVDCFKFRNKIGLDVAMEALLDCIRQRKATRDEMWTYAKICRMTNVMRPYMEMEAAR